MAVADLERPRTLALAAARERSSAASSAGGRPRTALAVAVLGFFVVTLDALIVNVALPTIGNDLGRGITGLQWVVDGYTLMFAALLLSSGALSDRIGARQSFAAGLALFVAASAACGLAPHLGVLIGARLAQGAGAALLLPASLALIREAYPETRKRAWAVAIWSVGASVASATGPIAGGLLTLLSWRLIFFVNLPVGLAALYLLTRVARSPGRPAPFDWVGQASAIVAIGALTYGPIEGGVDGFATTRMMGAFVLAIASVVVFFVSQYRGAHAMVPLELFRSRPVAVSVASGFSFTVGFYGLVSGGPRAISRRHWAGVRADDCLEFVRGPADAARRGALWSTDTDGRRPVPDGDWLVVRVPGGGRSTHPVAVTDHAAGRDRERTQRADIDRRATLGCSRPPGWHRQWRA
jgi:MFS family permease